METCLIKAEREVRIHSFRLRTVFMIKQVRRLINIRKVAIKIIETRWAGFNWLWGILKTKKFLGIIEESRRSKVSFQYVLNWRSMKVLSTWYIKKIFSSQSWAKSFQLRLVLVDLNWFERKWWHIFIIELETFNSSKLTKIKQC